MKKFWAVGLNFDYEILYEEENFNISRDWGSAESFNTLRDAKRQVRVWIRSAREELAMNLAEINFLTEYELKNS